MNTSVDISYYPLLETYKKPIKGFIRNLKSHEKITVKSNGMSTQVFGDYDDVMAILTTEIKAAFEVPHSVFILKIINNDLDKVPNI